MGTHANAVSPEDAAATATMAGAPSGTPAEGADAGGGAAAGEPLAEGMVGTYEPASEDPSGDWTKPDSGSWTPGDPRGWSAWAAQAAARVPVPARFGLTFLSGAGLVLLVLLLLFLMPAPGGRIRTCVSPRAVAGGARACARCAHARLSGRPRPPLRPSLLSYLQLLHRGD